jgi:hypothetical protein
MTTENVSHSLPSVTLDPSQLPSKGLSYPKGLKISYTGYTYGEVQSISASKKMSYEDMLRRAQAGIRLHGARMTIDEMTIFDILYLAIARKLSTLGGTEFEIQSICESKKCNKQYTRKFNSADVKFKDIEASELPLEFDLKGGQTVVMSPLTAGDFYALCEGGMFTRAMDSKKPLVDDPIAMKAAQVRNMKFVEAYKVIQSITDADDCELMDELDKILFHNVEPLMHKCEACGRENWLQLEGKESLIKPFRDGKTTVRDRIRHGKRNEPVTLAPKADGVHGSNEPERLASGEA